MITNMVWAISITKKLAIPAKVALLQSANILVHDLGASVHCMNDRNGDSNIHEGSGAGSVGALHKTMTASRIMDTAGTCATNLAKNS